MAPSRARGERREGVRGEKVVWLVKLEEGRRGRRGRRVERKR